ncbi:MAG: two-component system, sensor histidine kinase and response regulator [Mycobacteriales bacterium]|jgi:signal transduction histidine kinase
MTGKRILVVDDSATQAERLRLLLMREGYLVDKAPTGRDGLRQANAVTPDLIISDVTMPEMDGFEFCKAMKASMTTRRIPFILLTGRSSPTDIITGLACGADNFIPKPYEDSYLLDRIKRVFQELEHRKQGRLDMEVVLTVGGRELTVTADRQQIIELLFSTFEQLSRQHDELAETNRELRRARAEAERANQAKTEFLSRVSHEIRTPLHAILGFAELLETTELDGDGQKSVTMILSAGQHLLDLIGDLIDIGRIEEGELGLTPEPVGTEDLLAETIALLGPLATDRRIALADRRSVGGLCVIADRQRLKQVLINLVSNAIKYNNLGGSVIVESRLIPPDRARLEVTDTGPGIAPGLLTRLFSPFDRLGAERAADVEGTGLGLALSRRLVTAMGGAMGVDSEVGRGSTFWVELTVADGTATGVC